MQKIKNQDDSTNLSEIFPKTKIYDPLENKMILMRSLWEENERPLILIYWLRRFGCAICRISSSELTEALIKSNENMKDCLAHVAIGLDELDYDDFKLGNYFKEGKIFIDDNRCTYKALNFIKKGIFSLYGMLNPNIYIKAIQASKKGISSTLHGDGTQLGGTIIVDRKGNIIYRHIQKSYTDQPSIDDVVCNVRGYLQEHKLLQDSNS